MKEKLMKLIKHSTKWFPWSGLVLLILSYCLDPKIITPVVLIWFIWFIIDSIYTIYDYIQSWISRM